MRRIQLSSRAIGDGEPCLVIVDAGVNHNNVPERAYELIRAAARAGADVVKFQTYRADTITTKSAPRYWNSRLDTDSGGTQYDTFKRLDRLPPETYPEMMELCKREGVIFSSTPFDIESARFLGGLGMELFKISSSDITYLDMIKTIAEFGRPIILSAGTASIKEIKDAVKVIRKAGNEEIGLQHCMLSYPCRPEDANLRKMTKIMELFPDLPVGYSDHTEGIAIPLAAVTLGAKTLEKHYTIDKKLPDSPDHSFSLDPAELKSLVSDIRKVEASFGNFVDGYYPAEEKAFLYARKSLVATMDIPEGTKIEPRMLTCKRPGTGIYPRYINKVIGKKATVDINADTTLTWDMVN